MASMIDLGSLVIGDKKLIRKLKAMEPKIVKVIGKKALREGAKIIQRRAKELAPVDSGLLKKNIRVRSGGRSRNRISVAVVLPKRVKMGIPDAKGYYPAHVELGTSKQPPNPFFRNALKQTREQALKAIRIHLWAGISAEARKP